MFCFCFCASSEKEELPSSEERGEAKSAKMPGWGEPVNRKESLRAVVISKRNEQKQTVFVFMFLGSTVNSVKRG